MTKLKVRVYKEKKEEPAHTVTIPLGIVGIAMKFVTTKMKESLQSKGVDVEMLQNIAKSGEVQGIVAEIEDHEKNEKTIISIE